MIHHGSSRVAFYVAHAAWDARRRSPFNRLIDQLGSVPCEAVPSLKPEHASVWAKRLWRCATDDERGATHFVFLNDDVQIPRNFLGACLAITDAVPDEVVSLHTTSPVASWALAPWVRSYWLTGPGYIVPRARLLDLLAFAEAWAEPFTRMNEDNLIMQWAWSEQRPIWHTIPALVDHDTSVPSTLGYDHHPLRRTHIPWHAAPADILERLEDPAWWRPRELTPVVACPWRSTDQLKAIQRRNGAPPMCAFCEKTDGVFSESHETGAAICRKCALRVFASAVGVRLMTEGA